MRRKTMAFAMVLLCASMHVRGQKNHLYAGSHAYQCGVAIKGTLEFAEKKRPAFHFGLSGGIGRSIGWSWFYPSLHADIQFYNNGLGSPKNRVKRPSIIPELNLSATLTAGVTDRFKSTSKLRPGIRNYPLYYFNNLTRQPLQNPFNYSFSLGSTLVLNPMHRHPVQQVGFANIHIGQFQFSYGNDGTPFNSFGFGDGRDRYYTGIGIVTWTFPARTIVDNWELSYHKYTGFVPNAFEISNLLDLAFVNYSDDREGNYNKSMYTLSVASTTHHFHLGFSAYNSIKWDVQHIIHRNIFNAYHRVPHKYYFTPLLGLYMSDLKIDMR